MLPSHSDPIIFADAAAAQQLMTELYSHARSTKLVENGYDNIVGLIDDTYTLRFPRNAEALMRDRYEAFILQHIQSIHAPIVPHILSEHSEPHYFVTTYVPGSHLSAADISALSADEQKNIGEGVARFVFALHSTLSEDDVREAQHKFDPGDEPWPAYLRRTLGNQVFPTVEQDKLAKHYYNLWQRTASDSHLVGVHDDLHLDNMLFKDGHLTGVIDFGDTKVGIAEQDLRQLYRLNTYILSCAISEYTRLSGVSIDVETVRVWAIVQELAAYSHRYFHGEIHHAGFDRACKHLNEWLPDVTWGV